MMPICALSFLAEGYCERPNSAKMNTEAGSQRHTASESRSDLTLPSDHEDISNLADHRTLASRPSGARCLGQWQGKGGTARSG
jgi:hypothetical protein